MAQAQHFPAGSGLSFTLGRIALNFKVTGADNANAYTLC